MKRCPRCNRVETDETLKFCRTDGASLVDEEAPTDALTHASDPPINQLLKAGKSDDARTASTARSRAAPTAKANSSRRRLVFLAILAVVVISLAIAGLFAYRHAHDTEVAIDSIAVLPFENQSRDPDSDYLADGLTDSIIYRLSQLPNLKVSPRSSVFHHKGKGEDPITIGNELRVNAVLSGRITKHGDQITISTELTDVRYNKLLWGEQYDRNLSELLATQREIAREITEKLRVKISGEAQGLANKHYTENNDAYQSYLKGRFYWNKRTREGYSKAIEQFKEAIDKDPSFALAYAGLADCYNILSSYGLSSPNESFPLGKAAVTKALELDPNLAEAHTSFAYLKYQYEWDWAGAEREFKRAIELNPNYPTAHHWYGLALTNMGRLDEAFAELKRAQELDPLSVVIMASTGWALYHVKRYDEAIAEFQKALDMDENFVRALWGIGEPYELKQDFQKSIASLERAHQLDNSPSVFALLAASYARANRKAEARAILNELNQQMKLRYVDAYYVAEVYAGLGEKEQALRSLEAAYRERSSLIIWLKFEPKFDDLRSDPRYVDLLRRVGLN
jgi:TolB-like protein/Tfp pilus assembly protein PilF